MPNTVRFYLDENVQTEIAEQLKRRGIEVVTVRDLNLLGDEDTNHLNRAIEMGYVLCTHDSDFIQIATTGVEHAGIVIGNQRKHWIGDWVNGLSLIHTVYTADEMKNRVEYL